jgi:hypothetical protein
MSTRIFVSFFLAAGALLAGDQLREPNLKDLPKADFQKLLSQSFSDQKGQDHLIADANLARAAGASNGRCAIPLTDVQVDPKPFRIKRLPAQSTDKMALKSSTPACKNW